MNLYLETYTSPPRYPAAMCKRRKKLMVFTIASIYCSVICLYVGLPVLELEASFEYFTKLGKQTAVIRSTRLASDHKI